MAVAKRLPSGSWRVRAYGGKNATGKNIYKSFTASTKKQAELAALEWQTAHKDVAPVSNLFTVHEAMRAYIEENRPRLSPTTIKTYTITANTHFTEISAVPVYSLTQSQLNIAFQTELQKYAPKTIKNDVGFLTPVLKRYRPDFAFSLPLPKVYPQNKNIALQDDIAAIHEACKGTELELPFLLAVWLGLRMSEIRGLKYGDIHNHSVHISRAVVEGLDGKVEKTTKTPSSIRTLPLPEMIENLIGIGSPDEYIVKLSAKAIYNRFVRLCKRIGLPHYTFHSLRHSNATIMMDLGVPDKYIAARGGWGSQIYKQVYQHSTPAGTDAVTQTVDNLFKTIIKK